MIHTPKKKKRKPAKIELTDSEIAETVFGKRLKKELDKVIEDIDKKGVPKFMGT